MRPGPRGAATRDGSTKTWTAPGTSVRAPVSSRRAEVVTSTKNRSGSSGTSVRTVEHAAAMREWLSPMVERAAQVAREQALVARGHGRLAAGQAKDWAAPRVGAAMGWATPHLERGMERGLRVAAPRIEAAAERAVPAVDAIRDRIVEQVLPRLVEAVNTAALAGAAAGVAAGEALEEATDHGARMAKAGLRTAADRAGQVSGSRRRRRVMRRARIVALAAVGAGAVAGVAAWRRARAQESWGHPLDGARPTGSLIGDGARTGDVPGPVPVTDLAPSQTQDVPVEGPPLTTTTTSDPTDAVVETATEEGDSGRRPE